MPTRPQTWRLRSIYDGFEHAGLRTQLDQSASTPIDRAGRVVRVSGHVLDETGAQVGHFTRLLASGPEGLRARHEKFELAPAARGRGFARALQAHAEAGYADLAVTCITMHAEHVGSLLWPRLGFDFDIRLVAGDSEQARRAHVVLKLLSPHARRVADLPRPAELLALWDDDDDPRRRAAAAALRARLPSPASLARGELDGLLLDPRSLGEFDAGATGIGRTLMLGASWDGHKPLSSR